MNKVARMLRYWHTLRHLRASQIVARVRRRWIGGRAAPPVIAPIMRPLTLVGPATSIHKESWQGGGRFRFLSETRDLEEVGWDAAMMPALWRYNLHYFDFLDAVPPGSADAETATLLLHDWVEACVPGTAIAWDPYPTSLRIVNWIKHGLRQDARLPEGLLLSLAHQTNWLMANLERDILGNHLFANAKALVFAGLTLSHPDAPRWRSEGTALLLAQLDEQFLPDGGHFERTPMYHSILLEDVLDLLALATAVDNLALAARLRATAEQAFLWLNAMCHGDDQIAFFNDATFGIAREPAELRTYADRLNVATGDIAPPGRWLESGYARLTAAQALVLADIAPVGPDYQPGHAHADTLSFEFSLGKDRIVVNSGTSVYGLSELREAERATQAHSTVELAGTNSSDVWAGFRVGRRARATLIRHAEGMVEGEHDGYRDLPGRPIHRRSWELGKNVLTVTDRILSKSANPACLFFHLHPAITVAALDGTVHLTLPDGPPVTMTSTLPFQIVEGEWSRGFGDRVPTKVLVSRWLSNDNSQTTRFCW